MKGIFSRKKPHNPSPVDPVENADSASPEPVRDIVPLEGAGDSDK